MEPNYVDKKQFEDPSLVYAAHACCLAVIVGIAVVITLIYSIFKIIESL